MQTAATKHHVKYNSLQSTHIQICVSKSHNNMYHHAQMQHLGRFRDSQSFWDIVNGVEKFKKLNLRMNFTWRAAQSSNGQFLQN